MSQARINKLAEELATKYAGEAHQEWSEGAADAAYDAYVDRMADEYEATKEDK